MARAGGYSADFSSDHALVNSGRLVCPFNHENIPMILRHANVRAAAKDWQTFSSDAPRRVPIPSEEDVRSMRQLPIETLQVRLTAR